MTITQDRRPPRHRAPRRRLRRRILAAVLVVLLAGGTFVVVDALSRPGNDSAAAKLAEWGRDHGLNDLITWAEALQYERDQPAVGGTPTGGIPEAAGALPDGTGSTAPLSPLVDAGGLPGEGVWQTVVESHGRPAVEVTALRPDDKHTSFVVGVLRMDPTLVSGELHPGVQDPGGSWHAASSLVPAEQRTVAVAFNGGFRLNDPSRNGYYSEGRTVAPLRDGAASLVLHTDGTAAVGSWNGEVRMGPDVASVRQNLRMLVDGGKVDPSCATGGQKEWGNTIGQAAFIDRSGFGVTAAGTEVYVGGPALSVCTLGAVLADAGVVRGMELDINPDWVSGTYFHDSPDAPPVGYRLFPTEKVSPQHYLTASSRDWFSWQLR